MLADLLITNAHVLTQDPAHPRASTLAILGGRILAVDPDADIPARAVFDAEGLTVVPGFNDVHSHSVWFGFGLMETALGDARSLDDVYSAISAAADQLAPGEWVVASGFSPLLLGGAQPDRDRLDEASGGRPVWIAPHDAQIKPSDSTNATPPLIVLYPAISHSKPNGIKQPTNISTPPNNIR